VRIRFATPLLALVLPLALVGCSREPASDSAVPHKHVHHPPHGGTPVVLGDEVYHLELVLDTPNGVLQAYVFDRRRYVALPGAGRLAQGNQGL
jgi:hypothetical protein